MASIERRKGKDGTIGYRVKVRLRGEKPRTRTFKRKADAEAWARAAETDLSRGLYVPVSQDRKRTVGDLIDRTIDLLSDAKGGGVAEERFARPGSRRRSVGAWDGMRCR